MALLKGRKWFIMPLKAKYFHYFQQDQRNEVNQRIQANQSTRYIYFICHHISSMFKRTSLSILTSRLNSDKIQNKYYI